MAANQVSNQRNRSIGNQRSQGPSQSKQSQESKREPGIVERASDYMEQASDYASEYMSQGADYVRDMTRDREGAAVGAALAAGFGIGLVLGCSIARSYASTESSPRTWRDRMADEGLGRRLMESIERMVPDALAQHFGR